MVLAVAAWLHLAHIRTRSSVLPGTTGQSKVRLAALPEAGTESREVADSPAIVYVTNRFRWGDVVSEDIEQYIANLRLIGCPDKTIRDIIVPEVRKRSARSIAATPLNVGFWTSGRARAAAKRAWNEQTRKIEEEAHALVRRLFGAAAAADLEWRKYDLAEYAMVRFILGPVAEDVPHLIAATLQEAESREQAIRDRANGILLPEEEDAIRQIHSQSLKNLHQILTAPQMEEFTLREATVELVDKFKGFPLSPYELRDIAGLRVGIYGAFDMDSRSTDFPKPPDQEESKENQFLAQLAEYLGESRYKEYLRWQDPAFSSARELAQANGLPADTANRIYEMKQLLSEAEKQINDATSAAGAGGDALISQMREQCIMEVRRLLGEKAFNEYLGQGSGNWLTNRTNP